MTRNSSFIILSFAVLEGNDIMSAKGNHTIAVVKGSENYQTLQEAFSNVFFRPEQVQCQQQNHHW